MKFPDRRPPAPFAHAARVAAHVVARPMLRALSRALPCVLLAAVTAAGSTANAAGSFGDDTAPIPATEAFVPRVTAVDADGVALDWAIEDGYYLYRDKLSFALAGDATDARPSLGEPVFPEALVRDDEFFGESAIYRDSAPMRLPLTDLSAGQAAAGTALTLEVTFQGCADIGLCYPPTTTTLALEVPPSPSRSSPSMSLPQSSTAPPTAEPLPASSAIGSSSRPAFGESLFGTTDTVSDPPLLRPDEAYLASMTTSTPRAIELEWRIEPGYYLYRDKLAFEILDEDGAPLADVLDVSLPEGIEKHDEFFGDVRIFRDRVPVALVPGDGLVAGDAATLRMAWQGCADIGVCFPPSTLELPFVVVAADPGGDASAMTAGGPTGATSATDGPSSGDSSPADRASGAAPLVSEQDRLSGMLASSSLWLSVATFFGLGLLLAFTPCVLPMVPILSGLIVGRGERMGGARAFRLSLVYVLVMASTYAVAGVLVAVSGQNVQVWLQDPVVLSLFAALFVVLALSMFGLFELQVPRALQARLTEASNAQPAGRYRGVVAMGFLSTLIVGPCVTAPLAGALVFIADTGNAVVGGAALFALGLGMGTPLLLIGTSAGSLLPRSGAWMVRVKQGFGILLLGLAIWMLSRFLPASSTALLAGLLALLAGVWLGAADRLEAASGGWPRLAKGAGLAVSLYGVALLASAMAGGGNLITPLAVFGAGGGEAGANVAAADREHAFRRVDTVDALDREVAAASAGGQPVMLDFYADWCISCKEMEAFTFTDERVRALLAELHLVQADVTKNDADDKALLERFRLFAPPAIVFYDEAGQEIPGARVVGFMSAAKFAEHLRRVLSTTIAAR